MTAAIINRPRINATRADAADLAKVASGGLKGAGFIGTLGTVGGAISGALNLPVTWGVAGAAGIILSHAGLDISQLPGWMNPPAGSTTGSAIPLRT
jgi:hypothetical protein